MKNLIWVSILSLFFSESRAQRLFSRHETDSTVTAKYYSQSRSGEDSEIVYFHHGGFAFWRYSVAYLDSGRLKILQTKRIRLIHGGHWTVAYPWCERVFTRSSAVEAWGQAGLPFFYRRQHGKKKMLHWLQGDGVI